MTLTLKVLVAAAPVPKVKTAVPAVPDDPVSKNTEMKDFVQK